MEYKYLKTRKEKSTLWVEINNPPVNFLTVALLEELFDIVKQVSCDDSVRVFILTGGIAYGQETVDAITDMVGWIAPITVYPGEDELLALAQGALRVLNGEEPARVY